MANLDHSALTGLQLHAAFHYEQEGDPGAVGAYKWWFKPSTGVLKRRNAGDTDWVVVLDPATVPSTVQWKAPVRVATTAAGTLASSFENGDTIDGVVLATGDRILIKDQAAGAENGIYVVAASGAPARASDADSAAELIGSIVIVKEGTANADTGWLATNDSITLGTTALVFTKAFPAAAGVTDHGALSGLADDDHTQYQLRSEKNAANGYAGLGAGGLVAQAQLGSGSGGAGTKYLADDQTYKTPAAGLVIEEVDGAPTGTPTKLVLPNGTLSIVGGVATYTPAGGSSLTIQEVDGTPTGTPSTLKFTNGTVTDNGDGSFTVTIPTSSGAPTTAPYVTTTADGGLSAEKVLPQLANYSPDIPPSSPEAENDEFDDDSLAGAWTSYGSLDVLSETRYHGFLYMEESASAFSADGVRKAFTPGAVAFTVVAKASGFATANFGIAALELLDSSNALLGTNGVQWSTGGVLRSRIADGTVNITINGAAAAGPFWLRTDRNSGSTWKAWISFDGMTWYYLGTWTNGTTVAKAALTVSTGTAGVPGQVAWDYIRFFTSGAPIEIIGRAP